MPEIVLSTLNARYIHAAFGLRYLFANLGPLQHRACLAEFDINQRPLEIAESLLARNPAIIGLGVYIWNVAPTAEVIAIIKRLRPEIAIILGGPEVSYETESQAIFQFADHVITGEADLKFAEVCGQLLERRSPERRETGADSKRADSEISVPALPKIIPAEIADVSRLALPYDFYSDDDIAHRIIYVEASRGCPFTCEFCLSSLEIPVRQFPLPHFLEALQRLIERGVKQFKFVDRTFNLNISTSKAILEFCLARYQPGHFFHFEMVPDRLPAELRDMIKKFPPGTLQFEVGIQTFNPQIGALISRRQNYERLEENLRFLRNETGVHIHADLIAGLPGESLESFAMGFDRLVALGPHEIQVGILKRLRGTPIIRHDSDWQMVYSPHPPYEILQNKLIDFATMQRLRRFARYWDLVGNSGNFIATTPLIWSVFGVPPSGGSGEPAQAGTPNHSSFRSFLHFSDWLHARIRRTDAIALTRLMELLFEFLTRELKLDARHVAETMWRDYQRGGRHDKSGFLKDFLSAETCSDASRKSSNPVPKRQSRHLA